MAEFVNLEVSSSGVATIRIDRPKMNALSGQLTLELGEAIDAARADESVRAAVVWGGPKVFAAGADIKEMAARDPGRMIRYSGVLQDVFMRLQRLPVPTIAAVNGYALGGGCELALACDFRICAEDSQLGQPEILLGVIPGAGGSQRLPRLIGISRAKELIFSGRFVGSDEAERIGLVDRVVAPDGVYDAAVELANRYASGPSLALAMAKQAIDHGVEIDLDDAMLLERQAFAALFATEDQKIGMKSFLEKGPGHAEFVGR